MTEGKMSKEELRSFTITFVGFFSILIGAVIIMAICVWSWWPVLMFFGIVFGVGFLKRLTMGGNAPGSRRGPR